MMQVSTDRPASDGRLPIAAARGCLALTDARSSDTGRLAVQRLSARDVETVTSALSEVYSEVTVVRRRSSRSLRMEVVTCTLPNITCGRLRISSSTVRTPSYPHIAVCLPITGETVITSHSSSASVGGHAAAVVPSGGPVAVDYLTDDCAIETLVFEQTAVEAELARMLGAPLTRPLKFDSQLSLSAASPWSRTLSLLHSELSDPDGLAAVPAMSTRLGHLMMAGLLVSQPHNHSEDLAKPKAVLASKPIRKALEFIEDRPAEIETVADIASMVGLSVRALDDGFRRFVGTPPMTYLRNLRITRAHEELMAADPFSTTATAVARKWGFGHYGRFAADYRRRFGHKPSETLRRAC
jgi:AraC-like DNA-binding protein